MLLVYNLEGKIKFKSSNPTIKEYEMCAYHMMIYSIILEDFNEKMILINQRARADIGEFEYTTTVCIWTEENAISANM